MKNFSYELFIKFRDLIHSSFGIYYADSKKELLRIKIDKCLLKSGITSYEDYYKLLTSDNPGDYYTHFVDEITVNKTDFFREKDHFNFISNNMEFILSHNPSILKNKEIKVWSMASSTGQEAYTIAVVLKESLPPDIKIRILATDISSRVLKTAIAGVYPAGMKKDIEQNLFKRYFIESKDTFAAGREIKDLITFRQFNITRPFSFSGNFDLIFCRNVLIYFDSEVQQQTIKKIYNYLSPGGLLFLGQSESLLNKKYALKHLKYSIHIK